MINPIGMTVTEWTDRMALLVNSQPRVLFNPVDWQDWAEDLLDVGGEDGLNVPDPQDFTDWREWAERFNSVSDLMG